jgi:hypothetical protein
MRGEQPAGLMSVSVHPVTWEEWRRFARDVLGLAEDESAEYATLRCVEVKNRVSLGRSAATRPTAPDRSGT